MPHPLQSCVPAPSSGTLGQRKPQCWAAVLSFGIVGGDLSRTYRQDVARAFVEDWGPGLWPSAAQSLDRHMLSARARYAGKAALSPVVAQLAVQLLDHCRFACCTLFAGDAEPPAFNG